MTTCSLCGVEKDSNHDGTPEHVKNQIKKRYEANRNKYASNRDGVIIKCEVVSSFESYSHCIFPRISLSVKPNEEVVFKFSVQNESEHDILVAGVFLLSNHKSFAINDHGLIFGGNPYLLEGKKLLPRKINVTFKDSNIGMKDISIAFAFKIKNTNEDIVIIRQMVAMVANEKIEHEIMPSPFQNKFISTDNMQRSTQKVWNADMFIVPQKYKRIFAKNLKIDDDEEEAAIANYIMSKFKMGPSNPDNYELFFQHLLWYEEARTKILIRKYNMSGVKLSKLNSSKYVLYVPGVGEKRPSLLKGDRVIIVPNISNNKQPESYEGTISTIGENCIEIYKLSPGFPSDNPTFDIKFISSRLMFERMHSAVKAVKTAGHTSKIYPVANKKIPKVDKIENFFNENIKTNKHQRAAVEHILVKSSGTAPYIIHGPPGTGKTVTIVEAVLQLVKKDRNNRIFICTDTNAAADHVAKLLVRYHSEFGHDDFFLIRVNSVNRIWKDLPEELFPYSNGESEATHFPVTLKEIMRYNIVVATLGHSGKYDPGTNSYVTHVFIDEAAHTLEPLALLPLKSLLKKDGLLVLAGDHKQLEPVVHCREAADFGLRVSLMERLQLTCALYDEQRSDPVYFVMLLDNYRSHPAILALNNRLFYNGKLNVCAKEDPLSYVLEKNEKAIIFHGVRSIEQKMGRSPSFFNEMELQVIKGYVLSLLKEKVEPKDIGIISPYLLQVVKIKEWLRDNYYTGIEVGTVETFQGREKRIVLITTVRGNLDKLKYDSKYQLGFLVEDKRFNVALTRAKAKLIVVGNPYILSIDEKWRLFMEECRNNGVYNGEMVLENQ